MLELDYPSDAFIAQFARTHRLTPADVLRDIARLVAIHQMTVEAKFLNDNCVLCGGVAMRFYGSRRFTVTDTDASYRLDDWDELDLQAALDIEVEDLTIEAGDPAYWQRKNRLTTAQPVEFSEEFSNFRSDRRQRTFKVTVSRRGLIEPACWHPIVHDYPDMGIENIEVPVMDINEQLAEKILGWSVNGLAKHYLDCAWISGQMRAEISRETIIRCLTKKLDDAKKREPSNYAAFANVDDLRKPLEEGDSWMAPLTSEPGRAASIIRYIGPSVTMSHARPAVRKHLVPLLWPDGSAAPAAPTQGGA
jgi:predicted nucleotidyltransferase component of viral defense system